MMAFGFNYQPGSDTFPMNGQQQQGQQGPGLTPQSPAKILNLRLPRNLGQSPVAARELLTAPGAGGAPDLNAIISMLIRTIGGQGTDTFSGWMNNERDLSRPYLPMGQPDAGFSLAPIPQQSTPLPMPKITIGDQPGTEDRSQQGAASSPSNPLPLTTPWWQNKYEGEFQQ